MAFSYGFFNAKNLDRVYTAEDFTGYLSSIICDGVLDTYGDCFSCAAGDGISVSIGTGKAWIRGHYFTSDTKYSIDLQQYADESLSRYVTIGISCDLGDNARMCAIEVKSGTPASEPEIPVFENTDTKTYLTLATVYIRGGANSISQSDITDYRDDGEKCGYVKCILGKCKVTEMLEEMEQIYSTIDGIRKDITGLESGTLTSSIQALKGQADYNSNTISTLLNRINSIQYTIIPQLEEQIDSVDEKITNQIDTSVSQSKTYTDSLVKELEEKLDAVRNEFQEQIDDLSSKYDTLQSSYYVISSTLSAIGDSVSDLSSRVSALESK